MERFNKAGHFKWNRRRWK